MPRYVSAIVGTLAWLGVIGVRRPRLSSEEWGESLLLFAALVLFPLALRLAADRDGQDRDEQTSGVSSGRLVLWTWVSRLQLPAALLLAAAYLRKPDDIAVALSLPWLLLLSATALAGTCRLLTHRRWFSAQACVDIALIYPVVGGVWVMVDRAGLRPLDFDAVIVRLTAVHFHYAGFMLPLLTGLATARLTSPLLPSLNFAVIAGVPLVAAGITCTQLGYSPILEVASALWLALAAAGVGWLYLSLASSKEWPRIARLLWTIAGATLLASMTLAGLYGLRAILPPTTIEWLTIPRMQAVHGTANAFGFSLLGAAGWFAATRRCPARSS